jgi:LmbE family N-acetylglucosaminyl deacetylase
MNPSPLTLPMRRLYRKLLQQRAKPCDEESLKRSALVFSPHQDDETLGCGGTIVRKLKAGATVKLVFLTDGSQSHARWMPGPELKSMRTAEALAAARILGLFASEVTFLDFPDGNLERHQELAICQVGDLLQRYNPEEVFIPYARETPPDHAITHRIVLAALKSCDIRPTIYEYPIWFWCHWPWTEPVGRQRGFKASLRQNWRFRFGFELLRRFNCSISIGDVLALKQTALNQHQSQMERLNSIPEWPTLGDVADGEFLDCFFQDREYFHRYRFMP